MSRWRQARPTLHRVVAHTSAGGRGVIKDTLVVPEFSAIDVDFAADNPRLILFHCRRTWHQNFWRRAASSWLPTLRAINIGPAWVLRSN